MNFMEQIKNLLKLRQNNLLHLKKEKEKALDSVPEGYLRVCQTGNRTQYYQRKNPKDYSGTYIHKDNIDLAQKLAQKDYDKRVLEAVEKELNSIEKYLSSYPTQNAEQIYDTLHSARQKLISPIQESTDEYIQKWQKVQYHGKDFKGNTPEYYTAKGERVRSKSELIIADLLHKEAIPYRYEFPVQLRNIGKIYPDFTVLNTKNRKEFYWEHLGMMDDPDYAEKALQKIADYEQNGIFPGENLIITYETRKNPIKQKLVMLMIQHYLK